MYSLVRPLLFRLDAEKAHHLTLKVLEYTPSWMFHSAATMPIKAMGLQFPHPVGLAAGLDKNGSHLNALSKLGFSFIEIGTVTPKPQAGNPKPRLFRLPEAEAIINRMGFNNQGVHALVNHVKRSKYKGILGVNIGKNKDTHLNKASEDYASAFQAVYEVADYVTLNISSPNTPDLRQLQQGEYIADLLSLLSDEQKKLEDLRQYHVPLVVKISPDESEDTLKHMTAAFIKYGVEGIIATNTSCSREAVKSLAYGQETGGLSGKPIFEHSTRCLALLKQHLGNEITLIGVGGIDSIQSAQAKLDAGATLIQLYSGLIYKGPHLVSEIMSGLRTSK